MNVLYMNIKIDMQVSAVYVLVNEMHKWLVRLL